MSLPDEAYKFLPDHDGYFAHTLQQVVKDGLKEVGALGKVTNKTSNTVSFVRRSTHATDILEGQKSTSGCQCHMLELSALYDSINPESS